MQIPPIAGIGFCFAIFAAGATASFNLSAQPKTASGKVVQIATWKAFECQRGLIISIPPGNTVDIERATTACKPRESSIFLKLDSVSGANFVFLDRNLLERASGSIGIAGPLVCRSQSEPYVTPEELIGRKVTIRSSQNMPDANVFGSNPLPIVDLVIERPGTVDIADINAAAESIALFKSWKIGQTSLSNVSADLKYTKGEMLEGIVPKAAWSEDMETSPGGYHKGNLDTSKMTVTRADTNVDWCEAANNKQSAVILDLHQGEFFIGRLVLVTGVLVAKRLGYGIPEEAASLPSPSLAASEPKEISKRALPPLARQSTRKIIPKK